ncbi:MAG: glycoside hydrolase family 5 protein, partial [Planctomycetota bacterium]
MKTTKSLGYIFLVAIVLLSAVVENAYSDNDAVFRIARGVNISHWLSQSRRRGQQRQSFFTEKDVKLIAKLGYDHIRLPVDEEQLWDKDANKEKEAFELLHN